MYGKNHYSIVISLQLIKINEKKKGSDIKKFSQLVKNVPAVQETQVWSLGWKDPLEKEIPLEWQTTPVFLPGKSHGQRSLVGYSPWGCKSQA